MDVQLSHRRVTSRPRSPVLASNFGSKSPVFKLPTELTMLVFQEFRSFLGPPIILTHICRQWRQIAINGASLWTKICIQTRHPKQRLEHFSSLLAVQFDRSASLLLDVEWDAVVGDEYFLATMRLIREKAAFSRWRTLFIYLVSGPGADTPWSSVDRFTSLESLVVWEGTENTILGVIDSTTTSSLKALHSRRWDVNAATTFAKSLTHISSLRIEASDWDWDIQFLPANVASLQLDWHAAEDHPFPHIQTYTVNECLFYKGSNIDLRNMTSLTVTGHLEICCRVSLPALRELSMQTLEINSSGEIQAPVLDILRFIDSGYDCFPDFDDNIGLSATEQALLKPGYLLSPNTLVTADSYLPSTTLIILLAKSPQVTHATLQFDYWAHARAVLEKLVGLGQETDSLFMENEILCPRLSELRLDLGWKYSEPSESKKWLLDRLEARREVGVTHPLSIYVGWKGEGAYVLLTGH